MSNPDPGPAQCWQRRGGRRWRPGGLNIGELAKPTSDAGAEGSRRDRRQVTLQQHVVDGRRQNFSAQRDQLRGNRGGWVQRINLFHLRMLNEPATNSDSAHLVR